MHVLTAEGGPRDRGLERLTPRQRDVLKLIAEGRSNLGIARVLGISEKAVEMHTRHIYEQLGIYESPEDHRRVLAAILWRAHHAPPNRPAGPE